MKKRIKTFDGLRTLGLLLVLFYHLTTNIVPSGYLGVSIFFVLAGFLCMQKVLDRKKSVHLGDVKECLRIRFIKLYPALIVTIALTSLIMILFFSNFLKNYFYEVIYTILPISNIAQILSHESYFDAMNSLKPFTHIWALALEMQFYIIFFIVVYLFYNKRNSKKFFLGFILAFILSILISIILLLKGAEITRIYYGIDTRISTFLIGMIACVIANNNKLKKTIALKRYEGINFILETGLIIFMILIAFVYVKSNVVTIAILNSYAIIAGLLLIFFYAEDGKRKQNKLCRILTSKLFLSIAKRSYVIYLIHYPIIIFINRFLAYTNISVIAYVLITIFFIIITSEFTYRFVNAFFYDTKDIVTSYVLFYIFIVYIVVSEIIIRISTINQIVYTENQESYYIERSTPSIIIDDDGRDQYGLTPKRLNELLGYIYRVNSEIGGDATLTYREYMYNRDKKITLIGDSISNAAYEALNIYFPTSYLDCKSNRQLRDAVKVFDEIKDKGLLYDALVISLGTNSDHALEMDALEQIYDELEGRPLIIVTIVLPFTSTEKSRNKDLKKFVVEHDNCYIADWNATMKTKSAYFQGDGIHPKTLGNFAFAQIVYKAMVDAFTWEKKGDRWFYNGFYDYIPN